jgi:hypothetical protein
MLGQVPAIFALAGTQQALQVRQGTTTRFWSGKASGNPGMQLGEQMRPLYNLGRGRLGSGEDDMLGLLHDFLLSGETSAVGSRTNRVSHLKVKIVKRFSGVLKQAIVQLIKCNCSALELRVSEEERKGLEALVSRHKTPQQLAKRGRIVLAAGERKKERGDCQRRESECGYGSHLAWALEQFAKHPAHRTVHQ